MICIMTLYICEPISQKSIFVPMFLTVEGSDRGLKIKNFSDSSQIWLGWRNSSIISSTHNDGQCATHSMVHSAFFLLYSGSFYFFADILIQRYWSKETAVIYMFFTSVPISPVRNCRNSWSRHLKDIWKTLMAQLHLPFKSCFSNSESDSSGWPITK